MDASRYAIDIAAQMTGLETTNAELDALTAQLSGAGKGAEHFQEAIRRVSVDLDAAKASSASASAALASGVAAYSDLEAAAVQATKASEAAAKAVALRDDTKAKADAAALALANYAEKLNLAKVAAYAAQGADGQLNAALATAKDRHAQLEAAATKSARAAAKAAAAAAGAVPADAKAKADAANAAVNAYALTLQELEGRAKGAALSEKDLAQQLANVRKLAGHVDKSLAGDAEGLAKLQGGLSAVGGPLGRVGSMLVAPAKGFADLKTAMGSTNAIAIASAAGLAVAVVAVVAITAAAIAGTIAIARWAVGLADASRSAKLAAEAFDAMHPTTAALRGSFAALTDETGVQAEALQGLTERLRAAKVAAVDMPEALRAAALASAALGESGVGDFVADIQAGKQSVRELATATQTALGGIVARQMLGLEAQSARLKKNFDALFSGLEISPVLSGMQTLVGTFDKASVTGETIAFLFGTIFQPLIGQAEAAGYAVEAFVIGFEKAALEAYIAAKPLLKTLGFGDTKLSDTLDRAELAGKILLGTFVVLGVTFAGVAVVVGALVAAFAVAAAFLVGPLMIAGTAAVAGLLYLGRAFLRIPEYASQAWAAVRAAIPGPGEWLGIGQNIVLGIARGIASQAGSVLSAIGGVVNGAIGSAKKLLGIASPSRVMHQLGAYTGEGFVGGIEQEQGAASVAMAELVEPPSASPLTQMGALSGDFGPSSGNAQSTGDGAASRGAGGGLSLSGPFNFYGVKDAEDAEVRFGEMLTRLFEGDVAVLGGAVAT